MKLSAEQQSVVDALKDGNVIVNAVAGSGKTTTMLKIAETYKDKKCLLLTYNSRLRKESTEKAAGLDNITIHTFHSFGYHCFADKSFSTDNGIIAFLQSGKKVKHMKRGASVGFSDDMSGDDMSGDDINDDPSYGYLIDHFDILIIDEAQDLTRLYYDYILRIIGDLTPYICIIGDAYQSIYNYAGSDRRFITLADKIFPSPHRWFKLNMLTSFRITRPMSEFVNNQIGAERLLSIRDGEPVKLVVGCNGEGKYGYLKHLVENIRKSIFTYNSKNVFVLAKSVRSRIVQHIANEVSKFCLVHVPPSDECTIDQSSSKKKLIFSSFHQAKGLERDCVHVLGFDTNYYYKIHDPSDVMNNPWYVALTRAKKELFVYCDGPLMPWYKAGGESITNGIKNVLRKKDRVSNDTVTRMLRHIPSLATHELMKLVEVKTLRPAGAHVNLSGISKQMRFNKKYIENVSDLNGTAIVAEFEIIRRGECTLENQVRSNWGSRTPKIGRIISAFENTSCFSDDISTVNATKNTKNTKDMTVLELALAESVISGNEFRGRQIPNVNWERKKTLQLLIQRLIDYTAGEELLFEVPVHGLNKITDEPFVGKIDILTKNKIIEVKATSSLQTTHIFQVIIYGYMWARRNKDKEGEIIYPKLELYNVCTEELLEIKCLNYDLFMKRLFCEKIHQKKEPSDAEFIAGKEPYCDKCF